MTMHPKIASGRVAIYARYSSDRQSEATIEDQVRRAREVIERAGGDPNHPHGRPVGSEIVIDEPTAAVVRRVFAMDRDGCALHFISRSLIQEKVPCARTRTRHTVFGWGPPGISGMLRQEKCIGIWRFKETQWVKEPGTNRRVPRKRPPDEVITIERPDLRIIDADLWSDVQARLRTRKRGTADATERVLSSPRSKYLLSGIVVCDECGKSLTIAGSSTSYYRCQTHRAKGSCGNDLRVREDLLRVECLEAIRSELRVPANLAYVRQQVAERLRNHAAQQRTELEERRHASRRRGSARSSSWTSSRAATARR